MKSHQYPLVTVMIPCFNQRKYVVDAINSVLVQDYPNLEIVVSDDASTDGTDLLLKEYGKENSFLYYRNKNNIGRLANYRKTLRERVSGEYVINLDGDDMLVCSDYISNAVSLLQEHNLKLVFGKRVRLGDKIDCECGSFKVFKGDFFDYYLDENISMPHLSSVYDRQTAIRLNFYSEEIISSDRVSLLNLAYDNPIGYLDQVAGAWRETGNNISRQVDVSKRVNNVALPYLVRSAVKRRCVDQNKLNQWCDRYGGHIVANYLAMYLLQRNINAFFSFMYEVAMRYPLSMTFRGLLSFVIKLFDRGRRSI